MLLLAFFYRSRPRRRKDDGGGGGGGHDDQSRAPPPHPRNRGKRGNGNETLKQIRVCLAGQLLEKLLSLLPQLHFTSRPHSTANPAIRDNGGTEKEHLKMQAVIQQCTTGCRNSSPQQPQLLFDNPIVRIHSSAARVRFLVFVCVWLLPKIKILLFWISVGRL